MEELTTRELVLLHLDDLADATASGGASTAGLGTALGFDDTVTDQIDLLSTLSSMEADGLLAVDQTPDDGGQTTADGAEQATVVDAEQAPPDDVGTTPDDTVDRATPGATDQATPDDADRRNVYRLTDDGRRAAGELRDRLRDRTVVLADDDRREVPAAELDEHVAAPLDEHVRVPTLAAALARVTPDGVFYRQDEDADLDPDRVVGREAELDAVRSHLDDVADGAGRPLLLVGEAGVGKTALLEHVLATARDRDWHVLHGSGGGPAAGAYHPIRRALADLVAEDAGGPISRATARAADLFDRPADTAVDDAVGTSPRFETRRAGFFYEVADVLREIAANRPVVLAVDDLHAADPATLDLLASVADAIDDAPILLVGAYRPAAVADDGRIATALRPRVADAGTILEVEPLDLAATRELVQCVLGTRAVPEQFVRRIYHRTGGTPLFVTESLAGLQEDGRVDPRHDRYPSPEADLPVPEQVRTTVERRLSALDDRGRTLIEQASVIGESVPFELLAAVGDLDEPTLREYVDALVDSRVLTGTDAGTLRFTHGVIREVVREGIDPERERRLHGRVADAITTVFADDLEDRYATVAHHAREAGDAERALSYYRRAGEQAASTYAHEVAVEAYETALELARDLDREEAVLDLMESIGEVQFTSGDYDAADRHFRYVRERVDDVDRKQQLFGYQCLLRSIRGRYEEALEYADRGLALGDDDVSATVCRLVGWKGWVLFQLGEIEEARELLHTEREMASGLDSDLARARALHRLGTAEFRSGNNEQAERYLQQAVDLWDPDRNKRNLATSLNNLGAVYLKMRTFESARDTFRRVIELTREGGDRASEALFLANLGFFRMKLGEWDEALSNYEEALEIATVLDLDRTIVIALKNASTIHIERGDLSTAREHLERSLERSEAIGYTLFVATSHIELARLERLEGDLEAAREHAEAGLETAIETDTEWAAQAHAVAGAIDRTEGRLEAARSHFRDGHALAEACDSDEMAARNRAGLAWALLAEDGSGDDDPADDSPADDGPTENGPADDDPADATEAAEAAVAAIEETATDASAYPRVRVRALIALAACRRVDGAFDAAAEAIESASTTADRLDASLLECDVLRERGLLARDRGDPGRARADLEAALALADDAGAALLAERCRRHLESLSAD